MLPSLNGAFYCSFLFSLHSSSLYASYDNVTNGRAIRHQFLFIYFFKQRNAPDVPFLVKYEGIHILSKQTSRGDALGSGRAAYLL